MGSAIFKLYGQTEYVETKYTSIEQIPVMDIDRNEHPITSFAPPSPTPPKYYMIINTASHNPSTQTQLADLKANQSLLAQKGVQVILVPSNSFNNEPNNFSQIRDSLSKKFDLPYPILSKLEVNEKYIHPLYKFLKRRSNKFDKELSSGKPLKGDYTKFLVDMSDQEKIQCIEPKIKLEEVLLGLA